LLRVVLTDPIIMHKCTCHVILRMRIELCSLHNGINAIFRPQYGFAENVNIMAICCQSNSTLLIFVVLVMWWRPCRRYRLF